LALALSAVIGLASATSAPAVHAQGAPQILKWADLMPPAPPKPPRSIVAGRTPVDPLNPTHEQSVPEGRWLSGGAAKASVPAPVVEALNGRIVQLGGYVVPLDFDATTLKEFLLVPFVGACVHVPPPPANQLVYVQVPKGVKINKMFDPVYVTGKITTTPSFTGLADAGYTLEAERVELRKE
jgi:hypothetical protein